MAWRKSGEPITQKEPAMAETGQLRTTPDDLALNFEGEINVEEVNFDDNGEAI